jgi:hypothetical protein
VVAGGSFAAAQTQQHPLTDIRNSRRIHSVITKGRVISPADRQRMLTDVEAAVKEPPSPTALAAGGCCGSGRPA